jgi:ABC-2 type transport system permease protein
MSTSFNATPSNLATESQNGAHVTPAEIPVTRQFVWLLRRELWENRAICWAPLGAAALFVIGFVTRTIVVRQGLHGWIGAEKSRQVLEIPSEMAGALIMGVGLIVGLFYSLDALYGERRDRSILFWKSLPVSDSLTVLSKFAVPLAVIPLITFAITLVTQLLMLTITSVMLLGSGVSAASLWSHSSLINFSFTLFYHMVTVHGLWYAPIYAYLFLASAWAPRAPFIWALLPPFVIYGVEEIAFNNSHLLNWLLRRLMGPENPDAPKGATLMQAMAAMTPLKFLSEPGLWIGLGITALLLFAAVRMRRYRGPA